MRTPEALAATALAGRGLRIERVGAEGLVVQAGDRRAEVGLGALRRVLALAPEAEHLARAERWARAVEDGLRQRPLAGEVGDRLVPRLLAQADPRLWTAPLAPGLHLALALDEPLHQRLLSPFDLPRLGLGLQAARERAMRNLRAATPDPTWAGPIATWAVGDGLDASRLLLAGTWVADAPGALAVAPARDLCRFVVVRTAEDLGPGARLALELPDLATVPYPLSPTLWWVPAGEGALAPVAVRLHQGTLRLGLPDDLLRRLP